MLRANDSVVVAHYAEGDFCAFGVHLPRNTPSNVRHVDPLAQIRVGFYFGIIETLFYRFSFDLSSLARSRQRVNWMMGADINPSLTRIAGAHCIEGLLILEPAPPDRYFDRPLALIHGCNKFVNGGYSAL